MGPWPAQIQPPQVLFQKLAIKAEMLVSYTTCLKKGTFICFRASPTPWSCTEALLPASKSAWLPAPSSLASCPWRGQGLVGSSEGTSCTGGKRSVVEGHRSTGHQCTAHPNPEIKMINCFKIRAFKRSFTKSNLPKFGLKICQSWIGTEFKRFSNCRGSNQGCKYFIRLQVPVDFD